MAAALTLLLIGSLLQGALCGEFMAFIPQNIEVLSGSCVTIPCSFNITTEYESNLDNTCKAVWMKDQNTIVFDSISSNSNPKNGELIGNLRNKSCTTTLNNIATDYSKLYFFRVECSNKLKYSFTKQKVNISFKADPPSPTLTPSTLKVKEGDSVSLSCSAPAPCLSHPPTLTWTPDLGGSQETLQDNQDKTKVKISSVTFTASHLHHKEEISCTAVYNKQDGSTASSVKMRVTADISYSPKHTTGSVNPSGPVLEGGNVSLTCSSTANPAVRTYTWYSADGGQETFIGTGAVLIFKVSKEYSSFFCKADNDIGVGQSNLSQIDVQYSPKHTTVSVNPSGPVLEGGNVSLTCSSTANPAVRTYTWYSADGGQETFIGTGAVLIFKVSKEYSSFFCKAENDIGVGQSNLSQIDVQCCVDSPDLPLQHNGGRSGNVRPVAPQILPSSNCSKAAAQLNCSCRTVGNPSATLQWYLDGQLVSHSDMLVISNTLNDKNLMSIITVNKLQDWDRSTLLCRSSNSVGSASQQFCVNSHKPQTSAPSQDRVMLSVFITTVVALLFLVCSLLCVIRAQKTHHNLQKSQCTGDTSIVNMSQLLTSGEGNEVPNTTEEDIYVNTNALRQTDVPTPATISEPNNAKLPSSGLNNAQGDSKSLMTQNEEGNNVIYSSVTWKPKNKKKKGEDYVDTHQPGSSFLEEERCMVGDRGKCFVDNALYMGSLHDKMEPRNVAKESEYAQVKYKNRGVMHK